MTKRRNALGLLLTVAMAPVFGWLYAGGWGAVLALLAWLVFYVLPRTTGIKLLGIFYSEFFTAEQLPLTMINITMAIVLGTLLFGMDVALYAALVGTPIVVLTLTVLALEPDEEATSETVPVIAENRRN